MILQTNPDLFAANKFAAKRVLRQKFKQMTERFFRNEFDKGGVDYNCQAAFEVAKEFGVDFTAISEMEVDYAIELSRKESA